MMSTTKPLDVAASPATVPTASAIAGDVADSATTSPFQTLLDVCIGGAVLQCPIAEGDGPMADSATEAQPSDAAVSTAAAPVIVAQIGALLHLTNAVADTALGELHATPDCEIAPTGPAASANDSIQSLVSQMSASVAPDLAAAATDTKTSVADGERRLASAGEATPAEKPPSFIPSLVSAAHSLTTHGDDNSAGESRSDAKDRQAGIPASNQVHIQPPSVAVNERAVVEPSMLSRLHSPVGTAAWRAELANRISVMIDRGEQIATLRLAPEHLGPLEIHIAVREGETSLWFGAPQAETRQALEQALPRLREQLASIGLSLGQSSIAHGGSQDPRQLHAAMTLGAMVENPSTAADPPAQPALQVGWRLVDTYV